MNAFVGLRAIQFDRWGFTGDSGVRLVVSALALLGLLAGSAQAQDFRAPPPKPGFSYPDCYCTNRGARFELGEFACLFVDGKQVLARCEMALNNPMWRPQTGDCPIAYNRLRIREDSDLMATIRLASEIFPLR